TARPDQALWGGPGRRRRVAHHRAWSARLLARALRLRQDDDVALDRRVRRALRGRDPGWRPPRVLASTDAAAGAAQHVHDLPELRFVAAHDGRGERRLWTEIAQA